MPTVFTPFGRSTGQTEKGAVDGGGVDERIFMTPCAALPRWCLIGEVVLFTDGQLSSVRRAIGMCNRTSAQSVRGSLLPTRENTDRVRRPPLEGVSRVPPSVFLELTQNEVDGRGLSGTPVPPRYLVYYSRKTLPRYLVYYSRKTLDIRRPTLVTTKSMVSHKRPLESVGSYGATWRRLFTLVCSIFDDVIPFKNKNSFLKGHCVAKDGTTTDTDGVAIVQIYLTDAFDSRVHVRDANSKTFCVLASQLRQYDGPMPASSQTAGVGGAAAAYRAAPAVEDSGDVQVGKTMYYEEHAVQIVSVNRYKETARIFLIESEGDGGGGSAAAAAAGGRSKQSMQRWGSTKASRTTFVSSVSPFYGL